MILTIGALPVTSQSSNGGATQGTIQAMISITYTRRRNDCHERVITLFVLLVGKCRSRV